jgi:cyclic nucleotide-binding protein
MNGVELRPAVFADAQKAPATVETTEARRDTIGAGRVLQDVTAVFLRVEGGRMGTLLEVMGWEEWAGHICYAILALSYLVTNIYWLRGLAILALGLEGIYFYFGSMPPLWIGIAWAIIFVAINAVQLVRLARERFTVNFNEHERSLHKEIFDGLTPVGFHRLLRSGEWRRYESGKILTVENAPVPELMVIADGVAKVEVNGNLAALVQAGSFVGEMSFLTGSAASATVTTVVPCRVFAIAKDRLEALLAMDEELRTTLHRVIGCDLVYKLKCSLPPLQGSA